MYDWEASYIAGIIDGDIIFFFFFFLKNFFFFFF